MGKNLRNYFVSDSSLDRVLSPIVIVCVISREDRKKNFFLRAKGLKAAIKAAFLVLFFKSFFRKDHFLEKK